MTRFMLRPQLLKNKYSIGVLVYNPFDDEDHQRRISSCLVSLIDAADNFGRENVYIHVLLNMSSPLGENSAPGVGHATKNLVNNLRGSYKNISIHEYSYKKSMNVKGYALLVECCLIDCADYISIFADDYVVPKNWFYIVNSEISKHTPDYLTPSTTFVAQTNLLVPIKWNSFPNINYVVSDGVRIGVKSGVDSDTVESMAIPAKRCKTIVFTGPVCFETTVFKANVLIKVRLCSEYYSLFYNIDLFLRIKAAGFKGVLSRKSFVFHYGKGATKAVYSSGDEKYDSSPAYRFLLNDIDLFNRRNGTNIKKWWEGDKPVRNTEYSYLHTQLLVIFYNLMSYVKKGVICGKRILG